MSAISCAPRKEAALEFPKGPIVLISIDTLRADRLGAWGHQPARTPNIDALAREGLVYENAWSHVPLTLPSHASMFTGRLPWEHGVRNNIGYQFDGSTHRSIVRSLSESGFRTGGAISAYVLRAGTGIADGFDFYEDAISSVGGQAQGRLSRPGGATAALAADWAASQGSNPFFLFLHIFEPHAPYDAPEPYRSSVSDPYDAEVAAADAIVGEFIERLRKQGQYENATIILVSDHGEGLGDHGEDEHGIFLYREAIHVPLIIRLPRGVNGGQRVKTNVQLADLAPTIASIAGIPFEATGKSLLAKIEDDRRIYSETFYPRIHLGWSELRSLVSGGFHYIEAPKPELYDMQADPRETRNVLSDNRRVYAALRTELESIDRALAPPSAIDPEQAARLAALGYIGTPRNTSGGNLPDPKDRIGDIARMKRAAAAGAAGKTGEAIQILQGLLQENPGLTDGWNLLGNYLDESGRHTEAVEAYKRAATAEPSLASEYALSIASALYRAERFDEALSHAEVARASDPTGALLLQGRIRLAMRDLPQAERAARTVAGSSTHGLQGQVLLAEVLTASGNLDEALRVIQAAKAEADRRAVAPVDAMSFVLGDLWARRGEVELAERYFREEIAAFPRKRQPYANLALLYMAAGRATDARRTMEDMVRANPSRETVARAEETMRTLGDVQAADGWRRRLEAY